MIRNRKDYVYYLQEDKKALGINIKHPIFSDNIMVILTDPCWRFQKLMRKLEYWTNCKKDIFWKPYIIFLRWKYQRLSMKLGFSIPINIFEEGLCIGHYGSIVVSRHAKIGKYCNINSCVNIGGSGSAAKIGDSCYIGPGAKIIKPVVLGNNIKIGANAVVNRSFDEDNIVLAGVPAKIVKHIDPAYRVFGKNS